MELPPVVVGLGLAGGEGDEGEGPGFRGAVGGVDWGAGFDGRGDFRRGEGGADPEDVLEAVEDVELGGVAAEGLEVGGGDEGGVADVEAEDLVDDVGVDGLGGWCEDHGHVPVDVEGAEAEHAAHL